MKENARPRRTQKQRREATIQKLIDATIESLASVGYGRTTVKEICGRAGLSHGALFRFFPSLLELVLAASEEVARRQIADFERRFARAQKGVDPIAAALALLRAACRARLNAVFYELCLAARTDPRLRRALKAPTRRYYEAIKAAAANVPGFQALPPDFAELLLFTAIHMFDGESLARLVLPQPALEEKRIDLFLNLLRLAAPA